MHDRRWLVERSPQGLPESKSDFGQSHTQAARGPSSLYLLHRFTANQPTQQKTQLTTVLSPIGQLIGSPKGGFLVPNFI